MKIERQIFQYAPLEEKKTVRDILSHIMLLMRFMQVKVKPKLIVAVIILLL